MGIWCKYRRPHIPSEWDDDVKDLVGRMLKKDPDERMVMAELRASSERFLIVV